MHNLLNYESVTNGAQDRPWKYLCNVEYTANDQIIAFYELGI